MEKIRVICSLLGFCCIGICLNFYSLADENFKEPTKKSKVIYPERTDLDYHGIELEGEVKNPGEFYFQRKAEEKFDSLVKRRKNFHKEMLRDVVLSK